MIRTVLEKLASWIRQEWEAASYAAATQGVTDGINAAIRDLTNGTITAEISIDAKNLRLDDAAKASTALAIPPEQIDGLRRKVDALELASRHQIELDASVTLAEMKEVLHAVKN